MNLLDDVFELLQVATRLEETNGNRIEAATKVRVFGVCQFDYMEVLDASQESFQGSFAGPLYHCPSR